MVSTQQLAKVSYKAKLSDGLPYALSKVLKKIFSVILSQAILDSGLAGKNPSDAKTQKEVGIFSAAGGSDAPSKALSTNC